MRGAHVVFSCCILFALPHCFAAPVQSDADSIAIAREAAKAYRIFLTDPDSAVTLAKQAFASAAEKHNTFLQGYSCFILSKAYWAKANYRLSSEYGFKALKIFESTSYFFYRGECYLSLARTFIDLKNFGQASIYIDRAFDLAHDHNDKKLLADTYREHSMYLTETYQYDSALIYSDRGLALYAEFQDTLNTSILLSRKSKTYYALRNFQKSMLFNRRATALDRLVGNNRGLGISYFYAAQNAFAMNETDSAIYFLKKSIPLNEALDNYATLVKIHNLLADVYSATGKSDKAIEELKIAAQFRDSLYNTEKVGQIQEMQSLYELESKNKTIAELGEENAMHEEQARAQKLFVAVQWIAITLLAALILLLVRTRRIQSRANKELHSKNQAIELQKEEIQAQAENLQQLNNLKLKLFSVISHDLRGPIASLHALLELLTNKQLSADDFVLFSGKLKTNLGITQRTLENLLNWSLSQMEGIKTEPEIIDVKLLVEDACRLMEEQANRKSIALVSTILDSIHVKADPNQLQLILRNLIHNAIKFSKTNQQVLMAAHTNAAHCEISIKDFGIGMNQEEINLIIGSEHFTKVGTQQEKGTGLGLLLCKEFITRNGGHLHINSKEGEGTEIVIMLPLAK